MDTGVALAVGVLLIALGAYGATVTQRWMERSGRATLAPLTLVPFGVLIGAGAAFARGWDLPLSILVGAILVPIVGIVGRIIEVRRYRYRRNRT